MTERNRTDKLEAPSNAIGKILSFIRERRYQPSERLPSERDFAEKFDTSRGAVREALAALETMRVIERRPNSGIYLRKIEESSIDALVLYAESGVPFEAKEIADVMEVRRMLEGQAVRLACTRRTADNIREITAILEETNKRLSKKQSIERDARCQAAFGLTNLVAPHIVSAASHGARLFDPQTSRKRDGWTVGRLSSAGSFENPRGALVSAVAV